MAAAATAGTTFSFTYGSPATLTAIVGVSSISQSGGERGTIDVTTLADTSSVTIGSRRAIISMDLTIFWDGSNAGHQALLANWAAATSTAVACSIVETDTGANTRAFSAYVSNISPTYELDAANARTVALVLTTAITETP
jgi:hypothetical protein